MKSPDSRNPAEIPADPPNGTGSRVIRLSVVLPTRDRARLLDDCLRSLARQTLSAEAFEVIVVDNGSTDDTAAVAAAHVGSLPVRCMSAPEPGLHVGRHAGMQAAASDLLVFGDDDIIPEPTWLASVLEAFEDPEVALVGGNNRPVFEGAPPDWLLAWWRQPVGPGRAMAPLSILDFGDGRFDIDPGFVWGCNFSIRRDVLLRAGGFHPDGVPADRLRWRGDGETHVADEIRRAGLRARFHGGASVGHRVSAGRMTPAYFTQRARAQGVSDSYTDLRRAGAAMPRLADRVRRRARALASRLRLSLPPARDPGESTLRELRRTMLAAHAAGYDFHQREVAGDPDLLAWVLKERYF